MSVRKRKWKTASGETRESWVVWYADQHGKGHIKTFDKKKAADAYHATVRIEIREGRHTAEGDRMTVAEAGKHWIATGESNNLERATLNEYRRHLEMLITPYLGHIKLAKLTAPMIAEFRTKLRTDGRTPAT